MYWYYTRLLQLPFSTFPSSESEFANENTIYLKLKIKGMEYEEKISEYGWSQDLIIFDERILKIFGFSKDIYNQDNYNRKYDNVLKVCNKILNWKERIIENAKVSYYISDTRIIAEAWNKFIKYAVDNNIEVDIIKIMYELFEKGKYRLIFHNKDYFLFEIVETKTKFEKAMLNGYIKDILLKAFNKEIEDSSRRQYTYSILDIINLGK